VLPLLLWFFIISLIVIIIQLAVINQKAEKIAVMIAGKERSELANLIKLRDAGILTVEEFEQKKKEYENWIAEKGHSDERKALKDLHEKGLLNDEELSKKLEALEKAESRGKSIGGIDLAEIKRRTACKDAICYAERTPDSWICICGTENKLSVRNCRKCFSNQGHVLENFTKETLWR
jgi:ribosomal protein L40E